MTLMAGRRQATQVFKQRVIEYAIGRGWLVHCDSSSNSTHSGWPDLCLARDHRVMAVVIKTDADVTTNAQERWLMALNEGGVVAVVWRVSDWDAVCKALA